MPLVSLYILMMPDATFRRFLKAVEDARSAGQAWDAASDLVRAEGAPRLRVILHGVRCASGPRVVHSSGFEAAAERRLDRVAARAARTDPVAARALAGAPPFVLSRFPEEEKLEPAAQETLLALRAAADGDFTLFAVFGPDGCDAVCGLGHPLRAGPPDDALHRIRAACQIAHLKALGPAYSGPMLTERELDVLRWIVHGKTNAAIAEILGCSVHTVDTHVRRIFAKLEVSDRTSVSLRAVNRGLVAL